MKLFLTIIFNDKHWKQAISRTQVLSRENEMLDFKDLFQAVTGDKKTSCLPPRPQVFSTWHSGVIVYLTTKAGNL